MVLVNFWRYPDPYQRFLIRIRIRPNDTDPTGSGSGSGSETLLQKKKNVFLKRGGGDRFFRKIYTPLIQQVVDKGTV